MPGTGKIVQVLGNVVDVEFTPETLPKINNALKVHVGGLGMQPSVNGQVGAAIELGGSAMQPRDLVLEVQGELGNNQSVAWRWVRPTGWYAVSRSKTPAIRSKSRSAKRRSAGSSTSSVKRSTHPSRCARPNSGRSTAIRRSLPRRIRRRRSSRPGSKSSI